MMTVIVGTSVLFVLIVFIVTVVEGARKDHAGLIMMSVAVFGFFLLCAFMVWRSRLRAFARPVARRALTRLRLRAQLYKIRTDEVDERSRNLTMAMLANVVFACVALLVLLYTKEKSGAPACVNQLGVYASQQPPSWFPQTCWYYPSCFGEQGSCMVLANGSSNYICGTLVVNGSSATCAF